ncbi:hypothetical protein [Nocardia sp. NPDC058497]|uniref:hypothetical protein n=1 Tax=Nocardia sp. NPDC058497 TaxID=3346529 RepID=UPI003667648C
MRRPRAMVLDEVWRGLDGVEALSGPRGGPLRRTVKLILDPLVVRPVQHPLCAGTVLSADGVALVTSLVLAHSDALRACADWFTVLKQVRRALRITEGNAQDLYFQRCFELATVHGAPGLDARAPAEAALREIHDSTGGRTTTALKAHVIEPNRLSELTALLDVAWRRRPLSDFGARDLSPALTELLEASTLARDGDPADAGPLLDELIEDQAGTHRGIALWRTHPAHGADDLGLTVHTCPQRPDLGASASTANLGLPFDRTVYERVFTVLQGSIDRTDLPGIPELVTTEISRSCSPWGLLDESLRVTAAAGCELALGLSPIGAASFSQQADTRAAAVARTDQASRPCHAQAGGTQADHAPVGAERPGHVPADDSQADHTQADDAQTSSAQSGVEGLATSPRGNLEQATSRGGADTRAGQPTTGGTAPDSGPSRAHEVVNSRWRREAYVLQARRYAVHVVDGATGPLAAVAAELHTPWRPYLRRLWVRLHGRDVREMPVVDPGELWDLLDGVARSVILDHRARVKQALTTMGEHAAAEARAS